MTGTATSAHRQHLIGAIGVLIVWNVAANAVEALWASAVFAVAGVVALAFIARHAGLRRSDIGLDPARIPSGLRWGFAAAAVIIALVAIATAIPASRDFLGDQRFADVGTGEMLYETLVRIPLVTALGEELAFRGFLLGLLLAVTSTGRAVTISSILFGMWHVLPGIGALDTAAADFSGPLAAVGGVAGQVVVTGAVGAAFAWLLFRSESLIAPILAHWTLNGVSYLTGWLILTNGWA